MNQSKVHDFVDTSRREAAVSISLVPAFMRLWNWCFNVRTSFSNGQLNRERMISAIPSNITAVAWRKAPVGEMPPEQTNQEFIPHVAEQS